MSDAGPHTCAQPGGSPLTCVACNFLGVIRLPDVLVPDTIGSDTNDEGT